MSCMRSVCGSRRFDSRFEASEVGHALYCGRNQALFLPYFFRSPRQTWDRTLFRSACICLPVFTWSMMMMGERTFISPSSNEKKRNTHISKPTLCVRSFLSSSSEFGVLKVSCTCETLDISRDKKKFASYRRLTLQR